MSPRPRLRQPARRAGGLATVEAAIVLPVFFLILFTLIDFSRYFFTQITLQHAMREGGRFAVTGRQLPDPLNPMSLQARLASVRQIVKQAAVGVDVDVSDIRISSVKGGQDSAGVPGDTVTISMSYTFEFVTPLVGQFFNDGSNTFTVSTSFRNEPFPPGAGT
jgi:hypothetical protein